MTFGLTEAEYAAALEAWQQRVAWQLIDRDRAYGAQCWDLSADWAETAAGIDPRDFWTLNRPGNPDHTLASSLWLYYPTHPAIEASLQPVGRHDTILPGDILVWARSRAYPASHTAVALEATDPARGCVLCMTQNPGPARPERLPLAGYLGALRPRTTTPPPHRRKEVTMIGMQGGDGEGRYGPKNAPIYVTYDGRAVVFVNKDDGDPLSVYMNPESFANVSYHAIEGYMAAAEIVVDARVNPPKILKSR